MINVSLRISIFIQLLCRLKIWKVARLNTLQVPSNTKKHRTLFFLVTADYYDPLYVKKNKRPGKNSPSLRDWLYHYPIAMTHNSGTHSVIRVSTAHNTNPLSLASLLLIFCTRHLDNTLFKIKHRKNHELPRN